MDIPHTYRLAKRRYSFGAFTLLEVLLAVSIASVLLATALYFYHQSARFRSDLIDETDRIASARLILNRMSSELRGTLFHPTRNVGFKGGSNWVEFLKSEVPSEASWTLATENSQSAYPETGYRLIRYELAMKNVIDTALDNEANREMIENLSLDTEDSGGGREDAVPLRQGDAIDRTEKRLITAKTSTNTVATINIDSVRITDQLKYMKFRYLDSGIWQDTWGGPNPPAGVEISLGVEPYSATNVLEEYTNHVFRRTISIPTKQVFSAENASSPVDENIETVEP